MSLQLLNGSYIVSRLSTPPTSLLSRRVEAIGESGAEGIGDVAWRESDGWRARVAYPGTFRGVGGKEEQPS